jgi:hypothetical protein
MEPHQLINQTSGDVEYFTHSKIVSRVRLVMNGIDLDPASCEEANQQIRANKIFTKDDDGLSQPWYGRVWLNWPFGISEKCCDPTITGKPCHKKICQKRGWHQQKDYAGNAGWVNKLITEFKEGRVTQACCICFASTSEDWIQPLMKYPQCFLNGREAYVKPDGLPMPGASKGSVVTGIGVDINRFAAAFQDLGVIKIALGEVKE